MAALSEQPQIRVTFIRDLRDLDAPGPDEIATGVELTGEMRFTRDPDVPPLTLPPVRSFEVVRWPDGSCAVRALDEDGHPVGEWPPLPGDRPMVKWAEERRP